MFDSLKIDYKGWELFYREVINIKIPNLELLSWCSNQMNPNHFKYFIQFLTNQPKLKNLGLSHCISIINADQCISELVSYIHKVKLNKLEIKGSPKFILGDKIIPLLQALLEQGSLTLLDISGQEVGKNGLDCVIKLISSGLKDLRISGSYTSSVEHLMQIINLIIDSNLKTCDWPRADVKALISKIPLTQRQSVIKQFDNIKKRFTSKFQNDEPDLDNMEARSLVRTSSILYLNQKRSSSEIFHNKDSEALNIRDEYTENGLKECLGIDDCSIDEPLLKALEKLNDSTLITQFINENQI